MPQRENSPREPRERPAESRETKEPRETIDPAVPLAPAAPVVPAPEKPVYRHAGSGQASRQVKQFKIDDIVRWDMNFGVMIGPVGYDSRMRCPYCEGKMQLSSHEGGTMVKGIRIVYHCNECTAQSMVQFFPPGHKLVLPDEDYGEITVVMREATPPKEQPARERAPRPVRAETKEKEEPRERPERQGRTDRGERPDQRQQERPTRSDRPDRPGQQPDRGEQQRRERSERPERRERREPTVMGERRESATERRDMQGERRPRRDEQGQEIAVVTNRENTGGQPRQRRYPPRPRPDRAEGKVESKAETNGSNNV